MKRLRGLLVLLGAAGNLLLLPTTALAEQRLVEFEGAPFSIGYQRQIGVRLLPLESPAGFAVAAVMPPAITSIEIVELHWPKSDSVVALAIGSLNVQLAESGMQAQTCLACVAGEGQAKQMDVFGATIPGFISRLCVWPLQAGDATELLLLFSTGEGGAESLVRALTLRQDGTAQALDTQGARTLYGWFDATDLDDDGSFELLTTRSLDMVEGGFTFHAIRAYDSAARGYRSTPELFKPYFEGELAWLNWVIETRGLIQGNPEPYLNRDPVGPAYVAEYQGRQFGFDSVIEVPLTFVGIGDVREYNRARREAFELVQSYRDELSAWLTGGALPATWRLPQ